MPVHQIRIGFHGKAHVGKDTAADHIAEQFISATRDSFAAPIKSALLAMGVPREYLFDPALKNTPIPGIGKSGREMAQTLGTEWGRQMISDDLWLALAKRRNENVGGFVVISDVRFENEAEWIREQGILVHINGPQRGAMTLKNLAHTSEDGVQFKANDWVVRNLGTHEELYTQLVDVALEARRQFAHLVQARG